MNAMTTADHIEALAMRIFRRDHPQRSWRSEIGDHAANDGDAASVEERALYRDFAIGRLAEDRRDAFA